MQDGTVQGDRVPMDDRGGDKTEARRARALVLKGAIANLALPVKEKRAPQRVAGLVLVQSRVAALTQIGIGPPLQAPPVSALLPPKSVQRGFRPGSSLSRVWRLRC